jgi:ribosomal protein RSM22 (predicted rRNA methylase)
VADLPFWLAQAVERHLEGRARTDLAARSARISTAYRAGGASRAAIAEEGDAIAYAVARMPATFAAASRVFAEIAELLPDFTPDIVLDAGAGPGTAGFAAIERWPDIRTLVQADHNPAFLALARSFAADVTLEPAQLRCELDALPPEPAAVDLAILCYVLAEAPEARAGDLALQLWRRTSGVLAVVEPGTPAGYRRILAVRERLLAEGARLLAPCPHARPCPLQAPDWCHFSERVARRRAHMAAKHAALPFENEPFSYLVAVRALPEANEHARIVGPPIASKAGIALQLCRPDGTAATQTVPRRNKPRHAAARRLRWGDRFDVGERPQAL